jgi:hypothetical protein
LGVEKEYAVTIINFHQFVSDIKSEILKVHETTPERIGKKPSPTACENLVVESSRLVVEGQNLNCTIEYAEGSHAFPDIVYSFPTGERYGIEVKSSISPNRSENNWIITGNSILGSTRIDVLDVYIIFLSINKKGFFVNSGRYEDAVSDVVVTHSPRYKINLSQNPSTSFFAKSGITYEMMKQSENPIGLVTEYFINQGQTAWWLAESAPAIILEWNDLNEGEHSEIYGKAFLFFPELFSPRGTTKYKRFAKWLVATYSVVDSSLRDKFTAGGRGPLRIQETTFENTPRIYLTFKDYFDDFKREICSIETEVLLKHWESYSPIHDSISERKQYWFNSVKQSFPPATHDDDSRLLLLLEKLLSEID